MIMSCIHKGDFCGLSDSEWRAAMADRRWRPRRAENAPALPQRLGSNGLAPLHHALSVPVIPEGEP